MADLFNKMKDGLNKGVATVSTGSKTMIEKAKVNSCIKTLESEKKQLSELLGNKIYTFCKENPQSDIPLSEAAGFCAEIEKRNTELELQQKKLEELDNEMNQLMETRSGSFSAICSCGYENNEGARFCAKCGNKLG